MHDDRPLPSTQQVERARTALRELLDTSLDDRVRASLAAATSALGRLVPSTERSDHVATLVGNRFLVKTTCSCGEDVETWPGFLVHLDRLGIDSRTAEPARYANGPYAGMTQMQAIRAKAAETPGPVDA